MVYWRVTKHVEKKVSIKVLFKGPQQLLEKIRQTMIFEKELLIWRFHKDNRHNKCTFSCLRKFLATESPLEMIKNAFYFISKALFVLNMFKLLFWLFGHVAKRLD